MKALIVALDAPGATPYGGTLQTQALLTGLRQLGHEVDVVAPSAPAVGARLGGGPLGRLKRALLPMPTARGARSPDLARRLAATAPVDLVICETLQQAAYLFAVDARWRWLSLADVQSLVATREAGYRHGPARWTAHGQARLLARRESSLGKKVDVVTAAGYGDASALTERGIPTTWLPVPVEPSPLPPAHHDVIRVGLFANFAYWANRDAYDVVAHCWRPAWDRTSVEVIVAGLASDQMPAAPDVKLLGPLPSPVDFYRRVDIVLSPVRRGGGMKVKIAEALAHGRPVVAVPEAVEGFPPAVAEQCLVVPADRPPDIDTLRAWRARAVDLSVLQPLSGDAYRERVATIIERLQ